MKAETPALNIIATCRISVGGHVVPDFQCQGVVSGTTVRAVVLGRFGQKIKKIDLKDTAKKRIETKTYKGGDALGRQCLLLGRFCSAWTGLFDLTGPVLLI